MKKTILFTSLSLLLACGSTNTESSINKTEIVNPVTYAESITQEELKTLLYTYASDEFEGRNTGEKGQKLAVDYLKKHYQKLDIPSAIPKNKYFQDVELQKQKIASAKLNVDGIDFQPFKNHILLSLSKSLDINTNSIVYAGFGIDSENYSDYKDIDVKGKIVLVKSGEPKDASGNYVTSGKKENTKWTNGRQSISSKRNAAKENGAKALLFVDQNLFSRYAPFYQKQAEGGFSDRLTIPNSDDFAFLMIDNTLAKALHKDITTDNTPKLLNTKLSLKATKESEVVKTENVAAFIKGSEKPNEILVISAHLDHEGIKNGNIYNGADDDGSGTVAMLEIAEAFKKAKKDGNGPKRSILFLHVTGEEKGLLGSRYYTDVSPIFPLENTIADLNIDMIGRTDPKRKTGSRNYVYLIGSDKLSTDLHKLSEEVNSKYTNIELDYTFNDENDPNRYYYRSDHYNFAKNNIPVIFYFNGTHDDYHQPTDTPDKIEYDLLENRTRLIFYTAWEIANRANTIKVDKEKM